MNFALKVWRQKNSKTAGSFVDYNCNNSQIPSKHVNRKSLTIS